MNADNHIEELEAFEGERGIPSVNEHTSGSSALRGLFVIGMVLLLLIVGGIGYWKTQQKAAKATIKKELQTSSIPTKTFSEPPPLPQPAQEEKVAPPPVAVVATPPPMPGDVEGSERGGKKAPVLDKAASSLMVGNNSGSNGGGKEPAATAQPATPTASQAPASPLTRDQGLASSLTATQTPPRSAGFIGNRNFILAKGSFIDCALQTRLDSTIPGMTACVITRNIYSDNGKVLLLERGSTVSGEYQSNMKQGMARIGVLWNRIKTPNGVVINLDSPGTDPLGGAGVPGYIDTHFWERFGGALMLSIVDDVAQYAVDQANGGNTENGQTINFSGTAESTQDMATEALKNTINIPPTLYKNQGEKVGIYIARDLDFSSVYDVRAE